MRPLSPTPAGPISDVIDHDLNEDIGAALRVDDERLEKGQALPMVRELATEVAEAVREAKVGIIGAQVRRVAAHNQVAVGEEHRIARKGKAHGVAE